MTILGGLRLSEVHFPFLGLKLDRFRKRTPGKVLRSKLLNLLVETFCLWNPKTKRKLKLSTFGQIPFFFGGKKMDPSLLRLVAANLMMFFKGNLLYQPAAPTLSNVTLNHGWESAPFHRHLPFWGQVLGDFSVGCFVGCLAGCFS